MDLYQEEILEHYRHPHNHGVLKNADITRTERNSSCGDELTFYMNVKEGKVTEVSFDGQGCAISQASASLLTDELVGMPIEEVRKMTKEDITELLGIELGPTRLKCALLSLQGVTNALAE